MPISPPLKSIPILTFNTLPRCTMRRIRAPNGEIMRFYRPLGQISALTFDLDDTLYDNRPVIDRTLHESLAFVRSYHPSLSQFDAHHLQQLRQTLLEAEPDIYHDVTEWRRRALVLGMMNAGLSAAQAESGADAAMANLPTGAA